jgi:hypothetical protein
MADRVRPYLFYDTAVSICTTCYRRIDAKIVFEDGNVFMLKRCPSTASSASDRRRHRLLQPLPRSLHQAPRDARPLQHAHQIRLPLRLRPLPRPRAALLPVARRDQRRLQPQLPHLLRRERSAPHRPTATWNRSSACSTPWSRNELPSPTSCRSPAASPPSIPISSHSRRRQAPPHPHLMVNTNGIRIAQMTSSPSGSPPTCRSFELYLQFDSLRREPLMQLRGADLRNIREKALERAEPLGISTTLVVTLERGVNDDEIGSASSTSPCPATLRPRRHLSARPAGRPPQQLRSRQRPPHPHRSAPPHSRTDLRLQARRPHPRPLPSRLARDGVRHEARHGKRAARLPA